jgi:hypothetical protein
MVGVVGMHRMTFEMELRCLKVSVNGCSQIISQTNLQQLLTRIVQSLQLFPHFFPQIRKARVIGELAPLYLGLRNSYPPRDERVHVICDCEFVNHAVGIRQAPQLRSLRATCGPKAERISCFLTDS